MTASQETKGKRGTLCVIYPSALMSIWLCFAPVYLLGCRLEEGFCPVVPVDVDMLDGVGWRGDAGGGGANHGEGGSL